MKLFNVLGLLHLQEDAYLVAKSIRNIKIGSANPVMLCTRALQLVPSKRVEYIM